MLPMKDAIANDTKIGTTRLKDDIRQTVTEVRDDLESAAGKAGRRVREYFDTASKEIAHVGDEVTTQIRNKPVQSSLMALAAGLLLGALMRR